MNDYLFHRMGTPNNENMTISFTALNQVEYRLPLHNIGVWASPEGVYQVLYNGEKIGISKGQYDAIQSIMSECFHGVIIFNGEGNILEKG